MASIRWTLGAKQDLQAIIEYIGRHSPTYAALTAERIVAAVERLRRQPRLGRMVPEFEELFIRELIVGNYRIVYRLKRKQIGIVAVVHGSRSLLKRFASAEWVLE